MLKDKPHNIDLILTEIQLPSISGLCLLTLIMGHETCKNIPVISMFTELKSYAENPIIGNNLCLFQLGCHSLCYVIYAVMSSHDSISIVFKCMMRGAADFLVNPIRRNELRNLWQHVWRKQTVCCLTISLRSIVFWN